MNNVSLVGRLTKDVELRYTQSQKAVAAFSIAVDRPYKRDGENNCDFINIVAWEKTAEFVEKWFHKGSPIGIEGSIQTRSYEAKDGSKRTAFEVLARQVSFVGNKSDNAAAEPKKDPDGWMEVDEEELPF